MNRIRAYLAATLTLVLLFAAVSPALALTSADAAAHAKAAQDALAQAAQQQALAQKLQGETQRLDKSVQSLQTQADALVPQIDAASGRTQSLSQQIERMRSQISSRTAQIGVTQAEVAREQGLLAQRVVASYKQGAWWIYVEMLLSAHDVRDLIARTELVGRVLQANGAVAEQLSATKTIMEHQKAELDQTVLDLGAKRREAAAVQDGLKGLQSARQSSVVAQESVLSQKAQLLSETQKNAKRLMTVARAEEAESASIKAELARAAHGSGSYHGVMAWPVPGFYTVTSPFGMRMHPILHVMRMHTGIDIGKNGSRPIAGAAIVAAGSGTVISAGYRSGYGNTVMIDHGNGVVTLYAHQPSGGIRVSAGQRVSKGQRIGTVGMSGYATGPHLHFEVRVNGRPVSPMRYL